MRDCLRILRSKSSETWNCEKFKISSKIVHKDAIIDVRPHQILCVPRDRDRESDGKFCRKLAITTRRVESCSAIMITICRPLLRENSKLIGGRSSNRCDSRAFRGAYLSMRIRARWLALGIESTVKLLVSEWAKGATGWFALALRFFFTRLPRMQNLTLNTVVLDRNRDGEGREEEIDKDKER